VLVELLTDPAAISAVAKARATYAVRSLAVRAGLAREGVVSTTGDGINSWVEVLDERAALVTLAALGVRASPGSPFVVTGGPSRHVRVTTGLLDDRDEGQLQHVIAALVTAAKAAPTLRGV
jgi:DNA-binding transcriptional MocR family regulator